MALVDVVMPLYNKAAYVARAIRSIQHQSLSDWRLLVVDDGSTDESPEVVKGIADSRIEMIHQSNQGPGAARNAGIARAAGKYLSFLDADDEWYPWFLANSVKALEEKEVGFAASMYYEWPRGEDMTEYWARREVRTGKYDLKGDEDPIWVNDLRKVVLAWNVVMQREIALKYGGFYEKDHCLSGEDTIFFMRLVFNEPFMIVVPAAVRYHLESSVLGYQSGKVQPIPPYLLDPESVLGYCAGGRREMAQKVLDYAAVGIGRRLARSGRKIEADDLLRRFPGARTYRRLYYRCRYEIALSRWVALWVRLKGAAGPAIRSFLRSQRERSKRGPEPPLMPYEQEEQPD